MKYFRHSVFIFCTILSLKSPFALAEENKQTQDTDVYQQICLSNCFLMKNSHDKETSSFFQCHELCNFSTTEQFLFHFSRFVSPFIPINSSEQILISKYPYEMFITFLLANRALYLCSEVPEGDACQHFVWSAFLYKELGLIWSKIILNAHEDTFTQDTHGTMIDHHNNEAGLTFAQNMEAFPESTSKQDQIIMEAFKQHLQENKLRINQTWIPTSAFLHGQRTNYGGVVLHKMFYIIYKISH